MEGSATKVFIPTFIAPRYNPPEETDPVLGGGPVAMPDGLDLSIAGTLKGTKIDAMCHNEKGKRKPEKEEVRKKKEENKKKKKEREEEQSEKNF